MWDELFADELGELPPVLHADGFSEFVVSRDRILAHPRAFYQRLLDWVVENSRTHGSPDPGRQGFVCGMSVIYSSRNGIACIKHVRGTGGHSLYQVGLVTDPAAPSAHQSLMYMTLMPLSSHPLCAIRQVNHDQCSPHKPSRYIFERMWGYIFGAPAVSYQLTECELLNCDYGCHEPSQLCNGRESSGKKLVKMLGMGQESRECEDQPRITDPQPGI